MTSDAPLYSETRYLHAKRSVDDRALNHGVIEAFAAAVAALALPRPLRVLELGAGVGTMVARLFDLGCVTAARYTLVDSDGGSLRSAAEHLGRLSGTDVEVDLVEADVFDWLETFALPPSTPSSPPPFWTWSTCRRCCLWCGAASARRRLLVLHQLRRRDHLRPRAGRRRRPPSPLSPHHGRARPPRPPRRRESDRPPPPRNHPAQRRRLRPPAARLGGVACRQRQLPGRRGLLPPPHHPHHRPGALGLARPGRERLSPGSPRATPRSTAASSATSPINST